MAVVHAVADVADENPVELTPPLHEFVDPDALDAVVADGGCRAAFDAYGYRIVVDGDVLEVRHTGPRGVPQPDD